MRISRFDEQGGVLVYSFSMVNFSSKEARKLFSEYNIKIPLSAVKKTGSKSFYKEKYYDDGQITITSWPNIFKTLVVYLLNIVNSPSSPIDDSLFAKISQYILIALTHTNLEENDEFLSKFKQSLTNKNSDLFAIQEKLLKAGESLNLQLKAAEQPAAQNAEELVKYHYDLMKTNYSNYNSIVSGAREVCGNCNKLKASICKAISDGKIDETYVGRYVDEQQEYVLKSCDSGENFTTISFAEAIELSNSVRIMLEIGNIDEEIMTKNGLLPPRPIDVLIFKYLMSPSPLVRVIEDNDLNEEIKLELISEIAHRKPLGSSDRYIDVLSGEPKCPSENRRSVLFFAVEHGSVAVVKAVLDKIDGDIIKLKRKLWTGDARRDTKLHTVLHAAAARGDAEILELLLSRTKNVDIQSEDGMAPLHLVKNAECARLLLEEGANPNKNDNNGNTPLHLLCILTFNKDDQNKRKNSDILAAITVLLDKKYNVDIDAQNYFGFTPLHYALYVADPFGAPDWQLIKERVRLFCNRGANVNIKSLLCFFDSLQRGLLYTSEYQDVVLEITDMLIEQGVELNACGSRRETILHKVVMLRNPVILDFFLSYPDVRRMVNSRSNIGYTPLIEAIIHSPVNSKRVNEALSTIEYLLAIGADPLVKFNVSPIFGDLLSYTPREYCNAFSNDADYYQPLSEIFVAAEADVADGCVTSTVNTLGELRFKQAGKRDEREHKYDMLVAKLENLREIYPRVKCGFALLELFRLEQRILYSDERLSDSLVLTIIQHARAMWLQGDPDIQLSDKSLGLRIKSILFELGNKYLPLPDDTAHDKETKLAKLIACFLAANRETEEGSDYFYRGFLVELMALKMDKINMSLDELTATYPAQYSRAWQLINQQTGAMFLGGDTFSDKTLWNKHMFCNRYTMYYQNKQHILERHPLPAFKTFQAQDDNQREKAMRPRLFDHEI